MLLLLELSYRLLPRDVKIYKGRDTRQGYLENFEYYLRHCMHNILTELAA